MQTIAAKTAAAKTAAAKTATEVTVALQDIEIQTVRCPNCGSPAERCYSPSQQRIHTQCHECDYLLALCSETGRVLEAYAPGIPFLVSGLKSCA